MGSSDVDEAFNDFNRDILAPVVGTISLGTLEYEGGKIKPRGTTDAENEAKRALQEEKAQREALREEENLRNQREDIRASQRGRAARRAIARASRGSTSTGDTLGSEQDFLGL